MLGIKISLEEFTDRFKQIEERIIKSESRVIIIIEY